MNLEKLKNNLPATSTILYKEEFFNSSVLIPIIKIDGDYHFLFEKRAAKIRQGSEVCFPGGEFETDKDADYKSTAIRETEEELGIDKSEINLLGHLGTLIGPMGITVDAYVGYLNSTNLNDFNYDKNEVEKLFTIPVSYFIKYKPEIYYVRMEIHPTDIDENGKMINTLPAKELQLPDRYSQPWRGRKQKILVYKSEPEIVWGITAKLINAVIKLLE